MYTIHWLCSRCGATNSNPQNCPFLPHATSTPTDGDRQANTSSSYDGQRTAIGGLPIIFLPCIQPLSLSMPDLVILSSMQTLWG